MSVEGIILAAGFSSRVGRFKMTLPFGRSTVLEHTVINMHSVCDRVIVVGGYRIELIRELLNGYPYVDIVENQDYPTGMFSSVCCGISHVKGDSFFLTPGDYPLISASVYEIMNATKGDFVVPTHLGRKGHPILIRNRLGDDILALPKDSTLRDFVFSHEVTRVNVGEETIYLDIDSMEDYLRVKELRLKINKQEE